MQILLLEDDYTLSKEVSYFFESKSMQCDRVYDGSLLLQQFKLKPYDVIVLDINVPGKNGLEVCHSLRQEDPKVPILMLSAYGEIDEKLTAFDNGADDYMVKPFHLDELLARVYSLTRRKEVPQQKSNIYVIADLSIDVENKEVKRVGNVIRLTPKEFKLLLILAQANGRVLSKQEIADKLWDYYIETNQNTIEVYINFLRNKIDKSHDIKIIHTKAGFGYYLKEILG